MNKLVEQAIERMDRNKKGITFQDAYDAMQGAATHMPDSEFMFEAGRRSARLEIGRALQVRVLEAVKNELSKD